MKTVRKFQINKGMIAICEFFTYSLYYIEGEDKHAVSQKIIEIFEAIYAFYDYCTGDDGIRSFDGFSSAYNYATHY